MEKEFKSLSDKIFWIDDTVKRGRERLIRQSKIKNQNPSKYLRGDYIGRGRLLVKDVKEFIKLLKEDLSPRENTVLSDIDYSWVKSKIDKLAGRKLI